MTSPDTAVHQPAAGQAEPPVASARPRCTADRARSASPWPAALRDVASGPRGPGADGHMCGLFAVDIAGFTDPRRDEHVQLYLRERLYRMLELAFDGSGMPWRACRHEDRGDGVLVVVPPVIGVDSLADPLPERLCGLIRVHNRVSSQDARIQLRAAAHIGKVYRDDHGFAGDAASHLCRLLDAPRLKRLLASSGSDLAFIASDYLYSTVVRRHATLIDPAEFQQITIDVRHATATGWVRLMGSASAARVLPFDRSA